MLRGTAHCQRISSRHLPGSVHRPSKIRAIPGCAARASRKLPENCRKAGEAGLRVLCGGKKEMNPDWRQNPAYFRTQIIPDMPSSPPSHGRRRVRRGCDAGTYARKTLPAIHRCPPWRRAPPRSGRSQSCCSRAATAITTTPTTLPSSQCPFHALFTAAPGSTCAYPGSGRASPNRGSDAGTP
jgi:hypothetical protein